MALNPPMNSIGDPCRVEGEFFVMKRKNMEFEFKVDNGNKYTGKGFIVLTTARIIAVNTSLSKFKAFDLPLHLISKPEFKQPVFGANHICGECDPLMKFLPGKTHFKLWFMEGGCGTFVPMCFTMLEQTRKNKRIESKYTNALQNGTFKQVAFIDPNDPSIIFLEQPSIQSGNYNPCIPQISSVNMSQGFQPQQMSYMPNQPMMPPQQYQQSMMPPQQYQQPMMPPQQYQQPMMQPQFRQPMPTQQYQQPMMPPQQYQQPMMPPQQYQQPMMPPQQQYQQPNQPPQQYQQPPPQYQQPNQPPQQYQQVNQPPQQSNQPPQQYQQTNQPPSNQLPNPHENNYPELDTYPQPNINVLNNANIPNSNQNEGDKAKYFGFWGPELEKKN